MLTALGRALALTACLVVAAGAVAAKATRAEDKRPEDLKSLLLLSSNWTYQLQDAKPRELADTRYDVVVMDAFFGGGKREVEKLRALPVGKRRLVLAYLSIGEAEVYRFYWQVCCAGGKRPAWIGKENPRWPGNYRVQYWNDEWKSILFEGGVDSYLKQIVDLGFDGVYLDRVDVFQEYRATAAPDGESPRTKMVRLVSEISRAAKRLRPGMLIVAQNAEELVEDRAYLNAIDGVAKEDLLFGIAGDGKRNPASEIAHSVALLQRAYAAGKHIMVVEYLKDTARIEMARTEILELGFVPYFAPRSLGRLQIEDLESHDSHR